MRPSTTARRYADAAYQVASEDGQTAEWLSSLADIAAGVQRPDVAAFFKEPNVSREDKLATVDRMSASAPQGVRNLLRMLVGLDRIHLVPSILTEMRDLDRTAHGKLRATVTVARPISDAERQDISQRLGQALGKSVDVQTQVDPSILGGIVVRLGDRLIDASVKGRLDRLRGQLAS